MLGQASVFPQPDIGVLELNALVPLWLLFGP